MIAVYIIGIIFLIFIALMVLLGRDSYPNKTGAGTVIGLCVFVAIVIFIIVILVMKIIERM